LAFGGKGLTAPNPMGLVMTLEVVAFGWSWSSVQPG
jgi:hypothetical protein